MLHLGLRPELYVMGRTTSKDVEVTRAFAQTFDLRLNHIDLEAHEYIDAAHEICRTTNGIKSLDNWHTHMLATKSGYQPDDPVIVGNNGEHVRAMGFDYGVLALALDGLSQHDRHVITGPLLSRYWKLKTRVLLRRDELGKCHDALAGYYGSKRQTSKFMALMPQTSFVWQSDAFVLEQRRRTFQACGLKLMSRSFSPFSPFLSKAWIDAGWHLDLSWRLGSRWHRYAVERLFPALLDFPEEKERHRMLRRERHLSWVPGLNSLRGRSALSYVDYPTLMRRKDILGLLHDHAGELQDLMPKAVVHDIVDEQLRTGRRARLCGVLTGMAVWRSSLRADERRPVLPASQQSILESRAQRSS